MIRNYFRIAWRNLRRYKTYSIINIMGLSTGIAAAILIFTLVRYHLSFDNFHPDKDRIYRIVTETHDGMVNYDQAVPAPLGAAFRNDYTFAEYTARVVTFHEDLVTLPKEREVRKFNEI